MKVLAFEANVFFFFFSIHFGLAVWRLVSFLEYSPLVVWYSNGFWV
uniref:Uncharacterized protein n=1 Tax=Manihot esculenta TaxID=3983 RepID=A0A2C9U3T2_MANES